MNPKKVHPNEQWQANGVDKSAKGRNDYQVLMVLGPALNLRFGCEKLCALHVHAVERAERINIQ